MRIIIRRKKSGYILGFALFFIGFIVSFAILLKAWPTLSASNDPSALGSYLWTETINFGIGAGAGVTLKLMHLTIMGAAALVLGIFVLVLSRQVFSVSGENVLLQCPYCKNHWKASRAAGWAECPYCRQFIQPTVKKT